MGAVFIALAGWAYLGSTAQKDLKVWFLDVGQGDSALIRTQKGFDILVDGGPSTNLPSLLAQKIPFWDKKIDMIILSHPHADHLVGLLEVFRKYEIGEILWTGVACTTPECEKFENNISEYKVPESHPLAGKKIAIGDLSLTFVYPFQSLLGQKIEDYNDSSIVFSLAYKGKKVLFTGDTYEEEEKEMLNVPSIKAELKSDILKVAHHGSKSSSSPDFLAAVAPLYAVISVGAGNTYNLPNVQTLQNLRHITKVLRTDLNGEIEADISEKGEIKVTSDE